MEWISVNDRLPANNGDYLSFARGNYYVVEWSEFWGVFYQSDGPLNHSDITHWMPLPEPPKLCPPSATS